MTENEEGAASRGANATPVVDIIWRFTTDLAMQVRPTQVGQSTDHMLWTPKDHAVIRPVPPTDHTLAGPALGGGCHTHSAGSGPPSALASG